MNNLDRLFIGIEKDFEKVFLMILNIQSVYIEYLD